MKLKLVRQSRRARSRKSLLLPRKTEPMAPKMPRLVLAVVLCCLVAGTSAAEVYKYADAQGNVHFTDQRLEGTSYRLEWSRPAQEVSVPVRRFAATRRAVKRRDGLGSRRSRYASLIESVARQFKLDEELLHAVVRAESAYNPKAVSSAGAIGLMQLMPATAERYGVNDIWNPTQNLRGGARYLRDLLEQFDDDLMLALAAYNAGEGAVMRYGNRIPPYPETRNYVFKVIEFLQRARTDNAGA